MNPGSDTWTGKRIGLAGLIIGLTLAVLACSTNPEAWPRSGEGGPAVPARTGPEIFAATCAACHGAGGAGQPNWHIRNADGTLPAPPLNGDGHTWHHPDGLLYRIVKEGGKTLEAPELPGFKSAMPGFGDQLSHGEIVGVLEYVKSLWGDKTSRGISIRESQAIISERDPFPAGAAGQ